MSLPVSTCKRDGFPEAIIDGRKQCVGEYLNRCIGLQKITDVVLRNNELFYIFENGHELPLFCFCCDSPLVSKDLDGAKEEVVGRYLESMSWDIVPVEDRREAIEFYLEFSVEGMEGILQMSTSIKSAQELIHPQDCESIKKAEIREQKIINQRARLQKKEKVKQRKRRSRGRRKSKTAQSLDE